MVQQMKGHLLQTQLQTRGDVALAISQSSAYRARRTEAACIFRGKYSADARRAFVPGHVDTLRMVSKIIQVQTKLATCLGADNVSKLLDIARLTVGRQPHDFPFISVLRKAKELSGGGVDDSCRVWILNLAQHFDRVPFPSGPHRGDEVTKTIK